MACQTFHLFDSKEEAVAYRREHGTGGWIFALEGGGQALLFPPEMTASLVMLHPFSRTLGGTGELIP
jgi:hypothetical protein